MLFPTWTNAGDDNWRMGRALFCVATLRWKLPKDGGFSNMGVGERNVAGTCWLGYLNSTIGSPKNDQFGSIFLGPFFESRMFSAFWNQCSSNWIPSCATSLSSSFRRQLQSTRTAHVAQRSYKGQRHGKKHHHQQFGIANGTNQFLGRLYHLYLYRRKIVPPTSEMNIHWSQHRARLHLLLQKLVQNVNFVLGLLTNRIIGRQSWDREDVLPCNFWTVFSIWGWRNLRFYLRIAIDATRIAALSTHQNHHERR